MAIMRKRVIIGAAAIALLAVFAYAGFGVVKKRQFQVQVAQQVSEAAARLEPSLGLDINTPSMAELEKLDASIATVDASLQSLRSASARWNPALAEAADDYIAASLNVMRRQAGSLRGRQRFAESHKLLTAHLAQAGERSGQWVNDAVRLRQELDHAWFDYSTAATSLGNMLAGYPESRQKIAAMLPSASFPADGLAKDARQRAMTAVEATRGEHEQAKRLVAPR